MELKIDGLIQSIGDLPESLGDLLGDFSLFSGVFIRVNMKFLVFGKIGKESSVSDGGFGAGFGAGF